MSSFINEYLLFLAQWSTCEQLLVIDNQSENLSAGLTYMQKFMAHNSLIDESKNIFFLIEPGLDILHNNTTYLHLYINIKSSPGKFLILNILPNHVLFFTYIVNPTAES